VLTKLSWPYATMSIGLVLISIT